MGTHAAAVADRHELAPSGGEAEPGMEEGDAQTESQSEEHGGLGTVQRGHHGQQDDRDDRDTDERAALDGRRILSRRRRGAGGSGSGKGGHHSTVGILESRAGRVPRRETVPICLSRQGSVRIVRLLRLDRWGVVRPASHADP
jgi:hypothetical protein